MCVKYSARKKRQDKRNGAAVHGSAEKSRMMSAPIPMADAPPPVEALNRVLNAQEDYLSAPAIIAKVRGGRDRAYVNHNGMGRR